MIAGLHPELVTAVIVEDVGPERPRTVSDRRAGRMDVEANGWASIDELYAHAKTENPRTPEPILRAMSLPEAQIAQLVAMRTAWQPGQPVPDLPAGSTLAPQGSGTYSISSHARLPDGTQTEIIATVRLGPSGGFGQLYTPLAWRAGEID